MDSRGLYKTGTLVLVVVFTGYCPNIVKSATSPPFKGLECTCGKNCTYGSQKCEILRCVCPYEKGDYAENLTCSDKVLCPHNCCDMLPVPLRNFTATHFIYSEMYQNYDENETFTTLLFFTKLSGKPDAKWVMSIITQEKHEHDYQDESVLQNLFVTEAEINGSTEELLDNEDKIPTEFLDALENLEASHDFSEPVQCDINLKTACEAEFCTCLVYPENMAVPLVTSFRNLTEDNIVYDIGNNISTFETSSNLAPLTSIDVTRRPRCTVGGWAPAFNDSSPWVQFNNIEGNVCGLVIQGAEWSSSRRLDKFTVETKNGIIRPMGGNSHFLSGVVLYSKSIHLLSMPVKAPEFLRINVVEPENPREVGFRVSLISCGSSVKNYGEDTILERLGNMLEEVFNMSKKFESIPWEDPIGLVSEFYHHLQTFLEGNFDKYTSPENRRQEFVHGNVGFHVSIGRLKDMRTKGYNFSNSLLRSPTFNTLVNVYIPPGGIMFQNDRNEDDDDGTEVIVILSVVQHNDSFVHTDVNDEDRIRYKIISPIVTIRIFINGSRCEQDIQEIYVRIEHKVITEGIPMPYYFQEECVRRFKGKMGKDIHWSNDGCKSHCDQGNVICQMKCNHTTSFAVLQLLGESQLSKKGKIAASVLTTICSVISMISLVAALVLYFFLRSSIATAQYAIHSNLMVALLISLCIFMTLHIPKRSDAMCKATMFTLQYFFSAAFCWMLCEGIHLYRQIITVFDSGSKYIQIYFLLGWAVPLSFVVVSMLGITIQESRLNRCCESRPKPCFFSHEDGSIWYFLVPVLIVIVINTGILARVTIVVVRAAKLQVEKDTSQSLYQAKAGLRSALLLVPLLGCSYVLGFVASVHGVFEILYDIINSLQGFFLALFYCVMNKEIRAAIGKYIKRSRDISTIQASTTGTNVQKFYPDVSKRRLSKRNQVEPAEELLEHSQIDDVD